MAELGGDDNHTGNIHMCGEGGGDGGGSRHGHSDRVQVDRVPALRGRGLRFVLVEELRRHGTLRVCEMVKIIDGYGYPLDGRASKLISDSLRWELRRGRVTRVARGVYRYATVPPTTARRIRLYASQAHAWITAVVNGHTPPPTPETPYHRKTSWKRCTENPARAPWDPLTWLWST